MFEGLRTQPLEGSAGSRPHFYVNPYQLLEDKLIVCARFTLTRLQITVLLKWLLETPTFNTWLRP